MKVGGGSKRTFGNMNRAVAVTAASIDAVKAVHASVIHERNERRCIGAFAAAAGALAGAGLGGACAEVIVESSLLMIESPSCVRRAKPASI